MPMNSPILHRRDATVPLEDEVRSMLRAAMKGRDRAAIAQAMTDLLGRPVTTSMLAEFTRNGNGKRQSRFPLAWTKPLCAAVGNDDIARSQLSERSRRALGLGDLLLPWVLERAAKGKRPRKS